MIGGSGLRGGCDSPPKDDERRPAMWREDLPAEDQEGEDDVGDVELCKSSLAEADNAVHGMCALTIVKSHS